MQATLLWNSVDSERRVIMSEQTKTAVKQGGMNTKVRYITVTAMLSAVAFVLMYLEIAIPIMPSFIKFDFSDLPALLGSFALGPVCGVLICLIKNVLHLAFSNSMFVGELSNFILGAVFVAIAGNIYKHKKTKKSAVVSGLVAALVMGIVSVFSNYFVVYPVYYKAGMAEEAILQMNLLEHSFFAFRDEDANGAFALVYRRYDGDYGLIEDEL